MSPKLRCASSPSPSRLLGPQFQLLAPKQSKVVNKHTNLHFCSSSPESSDQSSVPMDSASQCLPLRSRPLTWLRHHHRLRPHKLVKHALIGLLSAQLQFILHRQQSCQWANLVITPFTVPSAPGVNSRTLLTTLTGLFLHSYSCAAI